MSPSGQIEAGGPLDVVAITTRLPDPLPSDHVLLPWQLPRHPRTGLSKRGAAVCSWQAEVDPSRVARPIGSVPGRQMLEIAAILRSLRGE